MKTKLTLTCCLILLLASAIHAQTLTDAAKPVSWQRYKVGGEVFSVELPVLPAMHLSEKLLEGDKKPRREVELGSYADGVAYVVYVIENPDPKQSLQDFIAAESRSVRSFNDGRDVNRDGLAGKAFISAGAGDSLSQYFVGEERLYRFWAFGVSPEDPRITKFFSSVSFNKKTNAVEVSEGPGLPYQSGPPVSDDDELSNRTISGKEVTRKARLAMKPEPRYTEDARQNGITGTVVLKVLFSYDGSVKHITTVSGLPYGLTQKSIEVARRIKFIPAVKDGKYVSMWMQLEYNFNLY